MKIENGEVIVEHTDIASFDVTVAKIIIQGIAGILHSEIFSAPAVADEDLPASLLVAYSDIADIDKQYFDKWRYILNEIHWAFTQAATERIFDYDVLNNKEFFDRINNGYRLFGKYLSNLWI